MARWRSATPPMTVPVVDWVLRMARVPAEDFLDAIARGGRADAGAARCARPMRWRGMSIRALAARSHGTSTAVGDDARRSPDRATPAPRRDAGLPADARAGLARRVLAALDAHRGLAGASARSDGFVRRAHGDLHLGNLCLWHGRPVPFDALEFDEALATIDLGYDLAFLLMDLDHRVGRAAANRVLNRYVARTGDAALTRGLPVFLSLRAMIRAHVEARRGQRATGRALSARGAGAICGRRRRSSWRSAACRAPASRRWRAPSRRSWARAPGALVLRSDEIRKRQHGAAPEQRLPQSAYSDDGKRGGVRRPRRHGARPPQPAATR